MANKEIKIVISAEDDYSAKLRKFNEAIGGTAGAVNQAAAATMSWTDFLRGRMGPAMKEFGNHTDAVRALSVEYKKYKATGVSSMDAVAGSTGGAKNALLGLRSAWIQIGAAVAGVAWLRSAAMDALENEKAFNQLRIQIEGLGKGYGSLSSEVNSAIEVSARYANMQGGNVAKTLQELMFHSGKYDESLQNLNLTLDLAYQKHISTTEAALLVGKAMSGNAAALGRVIPELMDLDEKLGKLRTRAQETAYAMAVLGERAEGARGQMTEHELAVERVTNAYLDLKQGIGGVTFEMGDQFIKNIKAPITYYNALADAIDRVTHAINPNIVLAEKSKITSEEEARAIHLVGNAHTQTAAQIAAAIKKKSDAIEAAKKKEEEERAAQNKRLRELEAPSGTNFLTAFIGTSLSGPTAQKVELAGLSLGETFVSAVQWGIEKKKAGLEVGDLTFKMEPDYQPSLERFFAYSDAMFTAQEDLDNALLDRQITISDQMISVEKKLQQTKMNLQFGAANNAVALLSVLGGKHKEFALIALAAQKGLAMAQVFISGKAAAAAALVPPPIGLGPVFGIPLAASIESYSYLNMALIAATGLAEGLMKGGGSPSGIGGGGGVGALPIQSPDLTPLSSEREAQSAINITLIVNTLDGADVNWAKIMEDNIAPALENYSGDGNRPLNITVSQRN